MMKKVLLLAFVIASYGVASAQQMMHWPEHANLPAVGEVALPGGGQPFKKAGGNVAGWFSPLSFVTNNAAGPFESYINIIHPDSSVYIVNTNNERYNVFIHSYGHNFDLRSDLWSAVPPDPGEELMPFHQKDSYSWDSLAFRYLYRRNYPDPNVVDTCFVFYYKNSIPNTYRQGGGFVFDTDTVIYTKPASYNVQRMSGAVFFNVDTILLFPEDTSSFNPATGWGQRFMVRPVGTTISRTTANSTSQYPNSWFGASFTFKPGHPWNFGDTAESRGNDPVENGINYFGGYYTLIKAPGPPPVSGLPKPMRSKYYAENSYLLPSSTRYGQTNGQGWSGFIPGLAYYDPQFIDMQAYCTGLSSVSVNELEAIGASLGTIYPNPVSTGNTVTIEYATKTAQTVSIEIFDLTGKKVATVVDNKKAEVGTNVASYTVDLSPGMYFYTLTAGNQMVGSKKFTVTR